MAFPATVPAVRGFSFLAIDTTLTHPAYGGSSTVGISIMPLILLLSAVSIVCQTTSSSTTMGPIFLCDIPHNSSLADAAQRDVSDMFYGVRGVVAGFDDPWLFQLLKIGE